MPLRAGFKKNVPLRPECRRNEDDAVKAFVTGNLEIEISEVDPRDNAYNFKKYDKDLNYLGVRDDEEAEQFIEEVKGRRQFTANVSFKNKNVSNYYQYAPCEFADRRKSLKGLLDFVAEDILKTMVPE